MKLLSFDIKSISFFFNDLVITPGSPELPEGGCCHDRLTDGSEVFLLGAEASLLPCRVFPGRLASLR